MKESLCLLSRSIAAETSPHLAITKVIETSIVSGKWDIVTDIVQVMSAEEFRLFHLLREDEEGL